LARREREILDALYAADGLTAAEVRERIPDPPGYSAVRALLRVLEEKGHVQHVEVGPRYVYSPRVPRASARLAALRGLVETFFGGSSQDAVAALIEDSGSTMGVEELDRLAAVIEAARKGGK
jgi:predicted transcriptional regulator